MPLGRMMRFLSPDWGGLARCNVASWIRCGQRTSSPSANSRSEGTNVSHAPRRVGPRKQTIPGLHHPRSHRAQCMWRRRLRWRITRANSTAHSHDAD